MTPAEPPPDQAEPAPDTAEPTTAPPPVWRARWPWIVAVVLAGCVVLGLVVGINVGLGGRSFFPAQLTPGAARPTIVVVARVDVSPSPVARSTTVPSASTSTTASTTTDSTAGEYIVADGDTMRGVAQKVYGDADLWPRIYSANRDLIGPNPDALQVGMHLRIPPADQ